MIRRDEFLADAIVSAKDHLPANATLGRIGGPTSSRSSATAQADARAMLRSMVRAIADLQRSDTEARIGAHAGFAQAPRDATGARRTGAPRRSRLARGRAKRDPASSSHSSARSTRCRKTRNSSTANCRARSLPRRSKCTTSRSSPPTAAGIVGVEALLRWTHPERGAIPPAVFIPVAEQMGLMDRLGAFVLRRALADAKRWPDLYVAVNLSPVQVRDRGIVDLVRAALAETGVPPSRLMLEITEGVLIDNPDEMVRRIERSACARRAPRARRFRLRLFQSRLSAALPVRQAQDRPQLRRGARAIPPTAA